MLIYRPSAELTGKRLSAHTIASLMLAQDVIEPGAIAPSVAMRADVLRFLLRERTISYWKGNGWLKADPFGTELRLTVDGHRKVEDRLAGEPKAQAVTVQQVAEAMQVILGALRTEQLDSFKLRGPEPTQSAIEPNIPETVPVVEMVATDERTLQAIWTRRGQSEFRAKLLTVYGARCAVTNCDAEEALEAAHITPFAAERNYEVSNGIIMRADIHTLFDLFLVSIQPDTNTVWFAPALLSHYGEFHGQAGRFPTEPDLRPSASRLATHYEQWCIRWRPAAR